MQFWPPDDEHMCSKHVEAWNKVIVKQKFCASSWLITEIKYEFSQFMILYPQIFKTNGSPEELFGSVSIFRTQNYWV